MLEQTITPKKSMKSNHPTVIYIGGYGRSGSTLLDILIGAHVDVEGVGELVNIYNEWGVVISNDDEHGCYWRRVKELYDEKVGCLDTTTVAEVIFSVEWIGGLFHHFSRGHKKTIFTDYSITQRALFSSIAQTSCKPIVLDSSKTAWRNAWRPLALNRAGLEIKVIHLIRDGRGVIWSFLRGDNVKMEKGESDIRLRLPVVRAILGWSIANVCVSFQRMLLPKGSVLKVRYEDLVKDPASELSRIGEAFGMSFREVESRISSDQPLKSGRQISGNRLRKHAAISIKPDEEWRAKLARPFRVAYWLLAAPVHLMIYSKFFDGK